MNAYSTFYSISFQRQLSVFFYPFLFALLSETWPSSGCYWAVRPNAQNHVSFQSFRGVVSACSPLKCFFVILQMTQRHTPVAQVCFHQKVIPIPFNAFIGPVTQAVVSANWFDTVQTGNVMKDSGETVFTNSQSSFSRRPRNEKHNLTYIMEWEKY